jgi:uncharacterized protein (UPF0332 family)
MTNPASSSWLGLARGSLQASNALGTSQTRSTVSRAYHAAFAAAHAVLLHFGDEPREFLRTWSHKTVPDALRACLARNAPDPVAKVYKQHVLELRNMRERADYQPEASVSETDATEAVRRARTIVKLAEEVLR